MLSFRGEAPLLLPDKLVHWVYAQSVDDDIRAYTWHVGGRLGEDVGVWPKEIHKSSFGCVVEMCTDLHYLARIHFIDFFSRFPALLPLLVSNIKAFDG